MVGTIRTFDMLAVGGTLMSLMFGRAAVDYGATVAILEPTGHIGGTSTGGLGIGDFVGGTNRWGLTKKLLQYIASHPPYNKTDGSEQRTFSSTEMNAAMNAVLLDRPDAMTVVKYAKIREVVFHPVTNAITAIWLWNGDVYLANHSTHDGSYEVDLGWCVVKCRDGRDSHLMWDEPIELVDHDGLFSIPGLNPTRYPKELKRGYDRLGNRFPGTTQPPPVGMPIGSGMAISQSKGWRFNLLLDIPEGRPWVKPSGWTEGDSREVVDMVINSGPPDGSAGGSFAGSIFPLGGSAQAISGTVQGQPGRYSTNGCDLPGVFTNPWCTATYEEREKIQEEAAWLTMGTNWAMMTHPDIPLSKRTGIARFTLPHDEFSDPGEYTLFPGWPPAFYVRDDRSIIGQYTMTAKNTQIIDGVDYSRCDDSISLGGYPIDVHTPLLFTREDGFLQKEGGVAYNSEVNYQIPLRCLLPHPEVCPNLSVSWGASGTTIWRASFRMEFTASNCGEAMGVLHGVAFSTGRTIHQVPYAELRAALLARGAYL